MVCVIIKLQVRYICRAHYVLICMICFYQSRTKSPVCWRLAGSRQNVSVNVHRQAHTHTHTEKCETYNELCERRCEEEELENAFARCSSPHWLRPRQKLRSSSAGEDTLLKTTTCQWCTHFFPHTHRNACSQLHGNAAFAWAVVLRFRANMKTIRTWIKGNPLTRF